MVAEMFNIVGFHTPSIPENEENFKEIKKCSPYDNRLYSSLKANEEQNKIERFSSQHFSRECYLEKILENLSPSDVRTILRSEDEFSQTKSWTRIFPTSNTHPYLQFLSSPSYSDRLMDAWEDKFGTCQGERERGHELLENFCKKMYHLEVPEIL